MISMSDIAEKAGVSRSTVSLVLNRRHEALRISEATSQRVLEAAAALGYRPNEMARAVATGKNHVLGFLAAEPSAEYIAAMLTGAIEEAQTQDYLVKVMRLGDDENDRRVVQRCIESRLAGVVCVYLQDDLQDELVRYNIPIARLDSSSERPLGVRVTSDDSNGSRLAVEHLVALGHRRIGFIGGDREGTTSRQRERGYREGMKTHGLMISERDVRYGNWETNRTMEATREVLTAARPPAERPTALLCANDVIAMAVLRAAHSLGLRVPEDLSVVGFANLAFSEYADPPLTTVAQPFQEMGRMAVRCLLAEQEGEDQEDTDSRPHAVEQVLPTRLVVRESTAVAPV